jgi:U3 small nucleolar RNA-associated protein 14
MSEQTQEVWEDDDVQAEFRDELIRVVGEEGASELIHLLPVFGQIWSAGSGAFGAANQLDKVIEVVGDKAKVVYKEVIVFAVVESLV